MKVADTEELIRAGVPAHTIDLYQMCGIDRVCPERAADGALYRPDPDGGRAFISPILAHRADTPETPDPWAFARFGNIIDLLAWDPAHPSRWARRTGNASWLGAVPPQYCSPEPVRVWRWPVEWFRAECTGIVILTRNRAEIYRLLSGCIGGILVDDGAHGAEIRSVLEHPWPAPRIFVERANRHAA
jgi:hypothetical protein